MQCGGVAESRTADPQVPSSKKKNLMGLSKLKENHLSVRMLDELF
jgi:hypothetical protein